MKINGIDIKKYDAKQLTADVQPPSFSNSYEWLTSAALPTEFETEVQICLLYTSVTIFSESDEVELARKIKSLMKANDFSFDGRNGDDSKPEDGIYMKAQRFSKFYETEE